MEHYSDGHSHLITTVAALTKNERMSKTKLELTWIGKDKRPKREPRILLEDPTTYPKLPVAVYFER